MSIQGSQTEKNLIKAFAGESQAKNRYTYFAKVAKEEGYVQISNIFTETARHEESHAKQFVKFLEGGNVEIIATYPAQKIGTTVENLRNSINNEKEEWTSLYKEFAEIADKEGYHKIAVKFKMIAKVEAEHEKRFTKLLQNIENNTVFEREKRTRWQCIKCGYVTEGNSAPEKCAACDHPRSYFQEYPENY